MDFRYILNLVTMCCAMAISLLLLAAAATGAKCSRITQKWFSVTVLLNILGLLCEFSVGFLQGYPGKTARIWLHILDWSCYVAAALLNVAFALYLTAYLREKGEVPKQTLLPVHLCSVASIVLATISEFTNLYAWYDSANVYHQSPFFSLALLPPTLSLLSLTAITIHYRASLSRRELATLLAYTLVPLLCSVLEMAIGGLWLSYFAASITLFLVYLNMQVETRYRMKAQETALAESRIAMMVSQIQPHFIFNSLSAITNLCENPKAREALTTFSEYLRVNMDSLSRKEPVPFAWEMKHAEEYLWLEKLRFSQKLAVEYDIRADDFLLPALSVQPLVENAVRHGLMRRAEGGSITITAEKTEQGYRVAVADNGVGFDPKIPREDGRSHTGIANVRLRLQALCGGTLRIESTPGQGTTAIIEIPERQEAAI